MKKVFFSIAKLFILSSLFAVNVNAQIAYVPLEKFDVANASTEIKTNDAKANKLKLGITKDFKKRYNDVSDATWYEYPNVTVAAFKKNDVTTRVMYLKNGRYLHSLITYDATHLDAEIKATITNQFKSYDITWVTEVHENNKVFYFINIETDTQFKQVIVNDGETQIYKEFKKSK